MSWYFSTDMWRCFFSKKEIELSVDKELTTKEIMDEIDKAWLLQEAKIRRYRQKLDEELYSDYEEIGGEG